MSDDCLFCKILNGDIPADIVFEDEQVIAIKDISPQAPVHLLVMPRRHIGTINDISEDDRVLMGHLPLVAQQLAAREGIDDAGYRLVMNCNAHGGQTVFHVHMHLLGGRQLTRLG